MTLDSEVRAYQAERLKRLAEQPRTTVYEAEHDHHEAWPADSVSAVLERIAARATTASSEAVDDFKFRKALLEDPETLRFQRDHPKLFWLASDRVQMREPRYRGAIAALLEVKRRTERGELQGEHEADAAATRVVMDALQQRTE